MRWLALVALLVGSAARAATPDIGVGVMHAETVACGFWYDCDKPHSLDLTKLGFIVGIAGERWRIDYVRSGTFRSDAIAFASDAPNLARYTGHGRFDGVQAIWRWKFLSVGGMTYIPRWEEHTVEHSIRGFWPNRPNLHIAPVIGLDRRWGHWRLALDEYLMCVNNRCKSGVYPPVWRNVAMLSVSWSL